ncbi:hypothetical protein ACFVH6_22045 [Spirillospora sp. NPDC127200]
MTDDLRDRIAAALRDRVWNAPKRQLPDGPGAILGATMHDLADAVLPVVKQETARIRQTVEDAPDVTAWTGTCSECGEPIEPGDQITWRLRWSPQGPIHGECR